MDYYRVESVRMYLPLPFQCIPASLGRSPTHKWIRQMLPGRPLHASAPIWNPVRYSMVSLCGFLSEPDRYRGFVAWLSRSLQALSNIPFLVSCYKPYSGTEGLHLSGLSTPRLLGLNPLYPMWNIGKRDPKTLMLLEVQVLQRVLIWGKLCHRISHGTSSFSMCQTTPTK